MKQKCTKYKIPWNRMVSVLVVANLLLGMFLSADFFYRDKSDVVQAATFNTETSSVEAPKYTTANVSYKEPQLIHDSDSVCDYYMLGYDMSYAYFFLPAIIGEYSQNLAEITWHFGDGKVQELWTVNLADKVKDSKLLSAVKTSNIYRPSTAELSGLGKLTNSERVIKYYCEGFESQTKYWTSNISRDSQYYYYATYYDSAYGYSGQSQYVLDGSTATYPYSVSGGVAPCFKIASGFGTNAIEVRTSDFNLEDISPESTLHASEGSDVLYLTVDDEENNLVSSLNNKRILEAVCGTTYSIPYNSPADTDYSNKDIKALGFKKYIDVIIRNPSGEVLYFGRLDEAKKGKNSVSLTIPSDLEVGVDYTMQIFEETAYDLLPISTISTPANAILTVTDDYMESITATTNYTAEYDSVVTDPDMFTVKTISSYGVSTPLDSSEYYFLKKSTLDSLADEKGGLKNIAEATLKKTPGINAIETPKVATSNDGDDIEAAVVYYKDGCPYAAYSTIHVKESSLSEDGQNDWLTDTQSGIVWNYQLDVSGNAINLYTEQSDISGIITGGVLNVPATIGQLDYPVRTIGGGSKTEPFIPTSYSGFNSIAFPDSMTGINDYAFYGSKASYSLNITSKVKNIGYGAFYNNSGLKSVSVTDAGVTIDSRAFAGCPKLESVTVSGTEGTIGQQAFYACPSLKTVAIMGDDVTIGSGAFAKDTGLAAVSFFNKVTIGENAFQGDTALTDIKMDNMNGTIEKKAFDGCTSLGKLYLNKNIRLSAYAFNNCTGLTTLRTNTELVGNSFAGCSGITTVILDDDITEVAYNWGGYAQEDGSISRSTKRTIYVKNRDTVFRFFADKDGNYYSSFGFMRPADGSYRANYRAFDVVYATTDDYKSTGNEQENTFSGLASYETGDTGNTFKTIAENIVTLSTEGFSAEGLSSDDTQKLLTANSASIFSEAKNTADSSGAEATMEEENLKTETKQTGIGASYPNSVIEGDSISKSKFKVYPTYNDGTPYDSLYGEDEFFILKQSEYSSLSTEQKKDSSYFKENTGDTVTAGKIEEGVTGTEYITVVWFSDDGKDYYTADIGITVTKYNAEDDLLNHYGSLEEVAQKVTDLEQQVSDYQKEQQDAVDAVNKYYGEECVENFPEAAEKILKDLEDTQHSLQTAQDDLASMKESAKNLIEYVDSNIGEVCTADGGRYSSSGDYSTDEICAYVQEAKNTAEAYITAQKSRMGELQSDYDSIVSLVRKCIEDTPEMELIYNADGKTYVFLDGETYDLSGYSAETGGTISYTDKSGEKVAAQVVISPDSEKITLSYTDSKGEKQERSFAVTTQQLERQLAARLSGLKSTMEEYEAGLESIREVLEGTEHEIDSSKPVAEQYGDIVTAINALKNKIAELQLELDEADSEKPDDAAELQKEIRQLKSDLNACIMDYSEQADYLEKYILNYKTSTELTGSKYLGNVGGTPVVWINGYAYPYTSKDGKNTAVIDRDGDKTAETEVTFTVDTEGVHVAYGDGTAEDFPETAAAIQRKAAALLSEIRKMLGEMSQELETLQSGLDDIADILDLTLDGLTADQKVEAVKKAVTELNRKYEEALSGKDITDADDKEFEEITTELGDIAENCGSVQETIKDMIDSSDNLTEEQIASLETLTGQLKTLKENIDSYVSLIQNIRTLLELSTEEKDSAILKAIKDLQDKVKTLTASNQSLVKENTDLKQQLAEVSGNSAGETGDDKESYNKGYNVGYAAGVKAASDSGSLTTTALATQITSLTTENETLTAQNETLQTENETVKKQNEELSSEVETITNDVSTVYEEILEINASMGLSTAKTASLTTTDGENKIEKIKKLYSDTAEKYKSAHEFSQQLSVSNNSLTQTSHIDFAYAP